MLERLGLEDIHQKDSKGICAVHEAAMWGQYEILKMLLERGGDVNIQDLEGNSPLHLACDKRIIGKITKQAFFNSVKVEILHL